MLSWWNAWGREVLTILGSICSIGFAAYSAGKFGQRLYTSYRSTMAPKLAAAEIEFLINRIKEDREMMLVTSKLVAHIATVSLLIAVMLILAAFLFAAGSAVAEPYFVFQLANISGAAALGVAGGLTTHLYNRCKSLPKTPYSSIYDSRQPQIAKLALKLTDSEDPEGIVRATAKAFLAGPKEKASHNFKLADETCKILYSDRLDKGWVIEHGMSRADWFTSSKNRPS